MNEPTDTQGPRSAVLRRVLMIATPILMVLAAMRFVLWWGGESQKAMLRGRRWPPESLMVFLGR